MFSVLNVAALALLFSRSNCQAYSGPQDPRVHTALTLEIPCNGVSTTPEGRIFLLYARVDGSTGPQVVEYNSTTNETRPYPDATWNNYTKGADPSTHLIRTNSQRIGPDGSLWLVDVGSPSFGAPVILPDGPKLVNVNLTTNTVKRVYNLGNVTLAESSIDDIRFNPHSRMAYITDAGVAAIVVLNLDTGAAVRLLNNDPSTSAYMPISGEGTLMHGTGWAFEYIYADQHEVSPDAMYYYYQPCSGGMSRIQTKYLDMALYNSSLATTLSQYVEPYARTPSTGGTAIDADGNIYNSDTDLQRILKIAPNGTMSLLVEDPRLLWVDAMWIDASGKLWMPAAQLNRGTPFNNGTSHVVKPLYVYTIDIGVGPPAVDHP